MGERIGLHNLLKTLLENVYFQPPPADEILYPCITYERSNIETTFANNNPYLIEKEYIVTVIDSDPDSIIPDKVAKLPKSKFDRHFTADNLYHDVFTIYY